MVHRRHLPPFAHRRPQRTRPGTVFWLPRCRGCVRPAGMSMSARDLPKRRARPGLPARTAGLATDTPASRKACITNFFALHAFIDGFPPHGVVDSDDRMASWNAGRPSSPGRRPRRRCCVRSLGRALPHGSAPSPARPAPQYRQTACSSLCGGDCACRCPSHKADAGPVDPAAAPLSMFTAITMLPARVPVCSPGEPSR